MWKGRYESDRRYNAIVKGKKGKGKEGTRYSSAEDCE